MNTKVLILAPVSDTHAQAVHRELGNLRVTPAFSDLRQMLVSGAFSYRLTSDGADCHFNQSFAGTEENRSSVDLLTFDSIWLRRPGSISAPSLPETWMRSFVEHESNRGVQSVFRNIDAFWINNPLSEYNARFKLSQLQLARQAGLSPPDTLVTNDPEQALAFYENCGGRIIYKTIDEASNLFFPRFEMPPGLVTMPVRPGDVKWFAQVRHCLHLFQKQIEKAADIRITVIGRQIFAAKILSQEGKGKIDFRLDYDVPMEPHELPEPVKTKILSLLQLMGLTFGAIDMCLDREGAYWFLEVNPSGQWLWLEERLSFPIARTIAETLVRGAG